MPMYKTISALWSDLNKCIPQVLENVGQEAYQHLREEVEEQVYSSTPLIYTRTGQTLNSVRLWPATKNQIIVGMDPDLITPSVGAFVRHGIYGDETLVYGKHQSASLQPYDDGGLQYILGKLEPSEPNAYNSSLKPSVYRHSYPGHEERPVIKDTLAWLNSNAATLGTDAIVKSMGVRKNEVT
jgi:hypothetical protein